MLADIFLRSLEPELDFPGNQLLRSLPRLSPPSLDCFDIGLGYERPSAGLGTAWGPSGMISLCTEGCAELLLTRAAELEGEGRLVDCNFEGPSLLLSGEDW